MSTSSLVSMLLGPGILGVLAKVTALLAVAGIAAFALSRASAAMRHLVWLTALAGCVMLAVTAPVAPRLDVPILAPERVVVPIARADRNVVPTRDVRATTRRDAVRRVDASTRTSSSTETTTYTYTDTTTGSWLASHATAIVGLAWLVGCLFVIGRCVIGHLAVARLVSRSHPVWSPSWDAAITTAVRDGDVDRDVRVLICEDLAAPVTSGVLHPVILLPPDAEQWSDERRHVVLIHELAHIARLDYVAQLVATAATALFWFHPVVWFASARLRAEAEHAADDRVLATGTPGVAYAGHLLELARVESALHLSAAVAVGMVRASRLEGRFRAMLDMNRSRAAVSRRLQAAATSLALAAMVPVAGLRAIPVPLSPVVVVETSVEPTVDVATVVAIQQRANDSIFERTIDAVAGERLLLDLETGGSVIIRGWDENRVRVRARLGGADWEDTRVTLERTLGGVRLRSDFDGAGQSRSTRHAFELWVPRRMDVELSSSGGSLAINDLTGEFRGNTGGGSITIQNATGHASLTTGGGTVRVTNSALDGTVSTGGGEVMITNVTGTLRGSSGSGPVITSPSGSGIGGVVESVGGGRSISTTNITGSTGYGRGIGGGVGGAISGTVSGSTITTNVSGGYGVGGGSATTTIRGSGGYGTGVSTNTITSSGVTTNVTSMTFDRGMLSGKFDYNYSKAGGSITLDAINEDARVSTGGGRVYVGSSTGFLSVSTGGGDIELPRVGGSVSAWTGAGEVTITVVGSDRADRYVDVFSGRGRVVLELPSNLDATFELETAYTETQPRTSIESDFALTQSESSQWDDSMGTPRKFVRARGTFGSGRGLIRVRVVNGDIVVKRGR